MTMQEINLAEVVPELKKVLLIGHEGSGKTHFMGTMPRPIYHISLDKGFYTLAGEDGITSCVILEDTRTRPTAYREFSDKLTEVLAGKMKYKYKDGREEPYKTICVDSLTAFSVMLFDHYQYVNSNVDKKASFTEYQLVKSKSEDLLNSLKRTPLYVACSALIMADKDELTGEIFYLANMVGGIRDTIGSYFDAVFYMQTDKRADGAISYEAVTVGSRRHKAKVRVPSSLHANISAKEIPDFQHIINKIQTAHKAKKGKENVTSNNS